MKVKLKDNKNKLPANCNFFGFSNENWVALNQGKQVDIDSIPEIAESYCVSTSEKGGK